MCGFVGAICNHDGVENRLIQATSAIAHRGPDDDGFFHSRDFHAGFRRLSIIDVAGSHQPIVSADERYMITFNGEIYNYQDLRNDLLASGHKFETQGDAEVILNLFIAHGPGMVKQLNGIFAIAIFDCENRELFLFRDHFGVKPLFYASQGTSIYYGSELNALQKLVPHQLKINERMISHFLTSMYLPSPWTIFEDVHSLEPGHYLRVKNGRLHLTRYWQPQFDYEAKSQSDLLDEMQHRIDVAVKRQLMSEVPLGAFLSGGIDSSLICLAASENLGESLNTFTAIINDTELNESKYASAIATKIKSTHNTLDVPHLDLNLLEDLVPRYGQPFADTSLLPTFLVCQLIRQNVTVVLGGDGADEMLCGYDRYFKARDSELSAVDFFTMQYFRVSEGFKRRYLRHDDVSTFELYAGQIDLDLTQPKQRIMRALDFRYFLEGDILQKVDISSMAHSLEARVPLLDRDLVDFALKLPESLLFDQGYNKKVLKDLLSRHMPHDFVHRQKVGFMLPVQRWVTTIQQQLKVEFNSLPALSFDIFDNKNLMSLVDQDEHTFESAYFLFGFYIFNIWLKSFHGVS